MKPRAERGKKGITNPGNELFNLGETTGRTQDVRQNQADKTGRDRQKNLRSQNTGQGHSGEPNQEQKLERTCTQG